MKNHRALYQLIRAGRCEHPDHCGILRPARHDPGHADGDHAHGKNPAVKVAGGGVHRVHPRHASDGAADVHLLRSSHDRRQNPRNFVDSELFALCRRHYCHEHEQLRVCRRGHPLGHSGGRLRPDRGSAQPIKNILPALGNEFVTVIKESSIVSVIGIADLMFRTNDVIALSYKSLECLAVAALIYFVLTFISSRLVSLAERKLSHGK